MTQVTLTAYQTQTLENYNGTGFASFSAARTLYNINGISYFNLDLETTAGGLYKRLWRAAAAFDLSSIPVGATITGVQLKAYCTNNSPYTDHAVIVSNSYAAQYINLNSVWNDTTTTLLSDTKVILSAASGADDVFLFNASGISVVQGSGPYLWVSLTLESDRTNTDPVIGANGWWYRKYNTASPAPRLVVDYTPPVPAAPTTLTATCTSGIGETTLTDKPVASFTADVTSGTAPLTVNLTDTSTNTPTSWLYEFGDGQTSTSQNPTHIYANSGIYTIRQTATNASGSSQYQMTITVKDASVSLPVAPSQASFTASPMVVAPGGTVTFTDTSSGTPVSWLYNFGDGNTSASQNPTHAYAAVGDYIVTQTVTDGNGWSTQAVQVIVVTADVTPTNNAPTATITASVLNGFAPLSVTFSATVSTVCEYLWNFGDGTTSALAAPTHLFVNPGTYTVSLTVTNIYGSTTSTITIIVAGVLVGGAMGGLYNFYYIIDQGNDRVLVFHMSDGSLYGYFGGTGSTLGKFHLPTDLTVCRPNIT